MKSAQPSTLSKIGKGAGSVLKSGAFWFVTIVGSAVFTFYKVESNEKQERKALLQGFATEVQHKLKEDGYTFKKGFTLTQGRLAGVKLPADFKKAAVFTVQRNDSLFDMTVVNKVISKGGIEKTYIYEKAFVGKVHKGKGYE